MWSWYVAFMLWTKIGFRHFSNDGDDMLLLCFKHQFFSFFVPLWKLWGHQIVRFFAYVTVWLPYRYSHFTSVHPTINFTLQTQDKQLNAWNDTKGKCNWKKVENYYAVGRNLITICTVHSRQFSFSCWLFFSYVPCTWCLNTHSHKTPQATHTVRPGCWRWNGIAALGLVFYFAGRWFLHAVLQWCWYIGQCDRPHQSRCVEPRKRKRPSTDEPYAFLPFHPSFDHHSFTDQYISLKLQKKNQKYMNSKMPASLPCHYNDKQKCHHNQCFKGANWYTQKTVLKQQSMAGHHILWFWYAWLCQHRPGCCGTPQTGCWLDWCVLSSLSCSFRPVHLSTGVSACCLDSWYSEGHSSHLSPRTTLFKVVYQLHTK